MLITCEDIPNASNCLYGRAGSVPLEGVNF